MDTSAHGLATLDYAIFALYVVVIISVGLIVSRKNKESTEGYFLAGKSIPWWAVGASLIAANISAEQFIGMSGSGFAIGLGIASYEFMAAITLIIVAKYFLPIFIEKGIYTIPQFVEQRFSKSLKTILAVFWICLYIFVNLTSVLYLGGLALETILGVPLMYSIIGLALFALVYSVYGGLSAVVWTDVIQVAVLIFGGFMTSYLAVSFIGGDTGFFGGMGMLYETFQYRGARFVGFWPTTGYDFTSPLPLLDHDHFVCLAIDEDNQAELTDSRIREWCKQIRPAFGLA